MSGCTLKNNKCFVPQNQIEYDLTGCATSNGRPISVSECHAKCALSYSGNVKIQCLNEGGTFQISGCQPNTCVLPKSGLEPYVTSACTGMKTESDCHLQCAPGYTNGDRLILALCRQDHSTFHIEGCAKEVLKPE